LAKVIANQRDKDAVGCSPAEKAGQASDQLNQILK
jgi:hypothetical protein